MPGAGCLVNAVLLIATITCVAANGFIAVADYARAPFVLANAARVRLPPVMLPYLATLKLAGAAGLVIGLCGVRPLGLAAGIGLTGFFVGAIVAHLRTRVFHNLAFPGAYLLLAVAATVFFAGGT